MVQRGKRFYAYKVDVRGLTRKQAAAKRKYEYQMWKLYSGLKDTYKEEISTSEKTYRKRSGNKISSIEHPVKDGKSTNHRPRRNYWGNLKEEDTYRENFHASFNYDHSNHDHEDDHDGFYDNDMLWK